MILLVALAVDAYFGRLNSIYQYIPHPARRMQEIVSWTQKNLVVGKESVLAAVILGGALVIGFLVHVAAQEISLGWVLELFLVVSFLNQQGLYMAAEDVLKKLKSKKNAATTIKTAISHYGTGFVDDVVAPAMWYVCAGLPGLLFYQAARLLVQGVGKKDVRVQKIYMILSWPPALFAGLYLMLAGLFIGKIKSVAAAMAAIKKIKKHGDVIPHITGLMLTTKSAKEGAAGLRQMQTVVSVACLVQVAVVAAYTLIYILL